MAHCATVSVFSELISVKRKVLSETKSESTGVDSYGTLCGSSKSNEAYEYVRVKSERVVAHVLGMLKCGQTEAAKAYTPDSIEGLIVGTAYKNENLIAKA